ncbi:MAG: YciI family protein [Bacteroidota bacterium]
MNEFMMIFRHVPDAAYEPSPKELEAEMKKWQDWIGGIAAQGKFVSTNQLTYEGKTVAPDGMITDGPYAEVKEVVGGYVFVKAASLEEAIDMTAGCPMFDHGGTVEVRKIMPSEF